jgi:hypothetical protein
MIVLVNAGDPLRAAHTVAFDEELKSEQGFGFQEVHRAERAGVSLGVGLVAARAAEPEQTVSVFASHCIRYLCSASHGSII